MGYATFAILFAVLDIGFIVVRIATLVALSGTFALATGVILVSLFPSTILPLLICAVKTVKWQRKPATGGEGTEV